MLRGVSNGGAVLLCDRESGLARFRHQGTPVHLLQEPAPRVLSTVTGQPMMESVSSFSPIPSACSACICVKTFFSVPFEGAGPANSKVLRRCRQMHAEHANGVARIKGGSPRV